MSLFVVEVSGFSEVVVEAPTAASARWFAAVKCHQAGYGAEPFDIIRRGVRAWPADESYRFAADIGLFRLLRVEPTARLETS